VGHGFKMIIHCIEDECSENVSYCGNGNCLNTINGRKCNCNEGFENQDQNPGLPCQDINECVLGYCGLGSCSNSEGSFNCTCPDGFSEGQGNNQCQTCESGFIPGELDVVNLGKLVRSWKEARDICSNYGDGNYTLPVPDSIRIS